MFLKAANFLLSRLPWFRDRYEAWSKTKRIIIAFLLYLVVLPVIPIVIAIIMYIRDPEGFKKSKALPILGAIIVAQLAAFGFIANQEPKVTPASTSDTVNSRTASPAQKPNASTAGDDTDKPQKTKEENDSASRSSEPTEGREFKNCSEAFKAGVHDIKSGDPSYRAELDRDRDGYACEQ